MSGLVDIWTSELAKLRNKQGQAAISSGGSVQTTSQETAHADDEKRSGGSLWWPTALAQALHVKKLLPALQCSEASLSMLVDIFSA